MNIAELSIRKSVITWVLTLLMVVVGANSFFELAWLEDPEFTIKDAVIMTPYPGASAAEVEEEVTNVIEKAIQELGQLKYVDKKRWYWSLCLAYALLPFAGIIPHALSGNEWWFGLPLVLVYILGPILDWILGEDQNNPPQEVISQLEQDHYYRRLTYISIPLHFLSFLLYLLKRQLE